MPNATIENTGVKVITPVICKNAAITPIIKLIITARPVQSRLVITIVFSGFCDIHSVKFPDVS